MKAAVTPSTGRRSSGGPPPESGSPEDGPGRPTGLFRSSPFGQAMGTYLPATVAFRLVNFGRIVLLTWWMTTQQFGLLNLLLLVINVLIPLCSLGLNEAVARYVPQHEVRGSLYQFFQRSLALLAVIAAVTVVVITAFSWVLGELFYAHLVENSAVRDVFRADAPRLAQVSAAVIGLCILYFYLLAMFKGLRMFTALAAMEVLHGLLFLAGSIAAIVTGHLSALTLTALYGISLVVPVGVFGLGLRRVMTRWTAQHRAAAGDDLIGKLVRFSIWAAAAGVTWQILVWYPKWFLGKVHGYDAVAVYTAARQIGQFILIGGMAVSAVVMTTVTKTWESRGRSAAQRQLSLAFRGTGFGLFLLCAAIALAKDLVFLVYSDAYAPGAAILPLQTLFFLVGAYLAFLPIYFQLIEKTRHIFLPWAVGVAANVLLAFWLVGPQMATVQGLTVWRWLAPLTSTLCTTGSSGPMGLKSASWCGVIAIVLALVLCVALLRAERCRLDRGAYVVMISAMLLAANRWILASGCVVLVLLAWRTEVLFSAEERGRLIGYVGGALRHVPVLGSLSRRRDRGR